MAYPTNSLAIVLAEIDSTLIRVKQYATSVSASFANTTSANEVIALRQRAKAVSTQLSQLSATPGIADYAKDQKNDQTLDVVAEFQAVQDALAAIVTNIESTFPVDADGYLLREKWDLTGSDTVPREFSPASLAALRTLVDNLIATIG